MATSQLNQFRLPGALGDILIDVRTTDATDPGPAIIVLHGFKGFKDWGMFPPLCERLARAGFTAVSLNVSGSGVDDAGEFVFPERFGHNTFSAEVQDLEQVRAALAGAELGVPAPSSIGLVGHSRGGGIAVLSAAVPGRYDALVTWASIATVMRWSAEQRAQWRERGRLDIVNARTGQVLPMYLEVLDEVESRGASSLNIEKAAGSVRIPWLVVHGAADEAVPWSEAERLVAARGSEGARLLRVVGAGHTFGAVHPFAGIPPALEQVFDATVRFLAENLR